MAVACSSPHFALGRTHTLCLRVSKKKDSGGNASFLSHQTPSRRFFVFVKSLLPKPAAALLLLLFLYCFLRRSRTMDTIELYVLTHNPKFFDKIDITSRNERFLLDQPSGGLFSLAKRIPKVVDVRRERQSTFQLKHIVSLADLPNDALIIADANLLMGSDGRCVRRRRSWIMVAVEANHDAKSHFVQRSGFKKEDVMIEDDLESPELLNLMVLKQTIGRLRA